MAREYDEQGRPTFEHQFVWGKEQGFEKEFYPDGQVNGICSIKTDGR